MTNTGKKRTLIATDPITGITHKRGTARTYTHIVLVDERDMKTGEIMPGRLGMALQWCGSPALAHKAMLAAQGKPWWANVRLLEVAQ